MQALIFYIVVPFIYLISLFPFWILYRISDMLYILLYYVFKYRKKVVYTNLKNSFPEKSQHDINRIAKQTFKNLCDIIVESIKMITITRKQAIKRCKFTEKDLTFLKKMAETNKSLIMATGHYCNWEWAGFCGALQLQHKVFAVYKPLSNKFFDRFIYKIRSRFETNLVAMNDTYKTMIDNRDDLTLTVFITDQTPSPKNSYWTRFLNQDTPVYIGVEKIARKINDLVFFIYLVRIKRGFYEFRLIKLFDQPSSTKEGEISEKQTKMLEQIIQDMPENWLWPHRRWKHKREKSELS